MATMETCANPGCDQPGTNRCSACKTTPYCGPICQTADWEHHKEECPGHLRKVGMANLVKAKGYFSGNNLAQALRHADIAATKLKQIKECPVESMALNEALRCKFNALNYMGQHRKALECAKEWYCLHLTKHTHPPAIDAGFALIESCIHNREFFDAVLYARTTWETLTLSRDSHIPEHLRHRFIACGAYHLSKSLFSLAQHGDMSADEKQSSGVEAIMLARKALEINTQLHGLEHANVASDMLLLAQVLAYFNDVDDDEILHLYEKTKAIFVRVEGSLSPNVAVCEGSLGISFKNRAKVAQAADAVERFVANLELALPHLREAARIYRIINHVDMADQFSRDADLTEEMLQKLASVRQA